VASLNLTMLPYLVDSYEQGWKLYDESKWLKAQFDKATQRDSGSSPPGKPAFAA